MIRGGCIVAVLFGSLAASAVPAHAQSLTAGAVQGIVRDSAGLLDDALVTLVDNATGERRAGTTPRDGSFRFSLLLPGDYDLIVERFGFQSRVIRRLPVRAGVELVVNVTMVSAAPDAKADSAAFVGAPSGGMRLDLHSTDATDDFVEINDPRMLLTTVGRLLPETDGALGALGLPGRLGAGMVDGVPRWGARHARLPDVPLDGLPFQLTSMRGVESAEGADAELAATGGGGQSAFSIPGARNLGAHGMLSGGSDGGIASFVISGPIVRDTALYAIGVTAVRYQPTLDPLWSRDSSASAIVGIARDSFPAANGSNDLSGYLADYQPTTSLVTAFGRFDGLLTKDHRLTVRAAGSSATLDDPTLGANFPVALGSRLTARDISAAATLLSTIGARIGSEFRMSVDVGTRDYGAAPQPGTTFTDGGFGGGTADVLPGTFKRSTIRGSETGHWRFQRWLTVKGGIQLNFNTFDQNYADGRAGSYVFGDSTAFATRTGSFRQTVGATPIAHFTTTAWTAFGQALLHPTPGFDLAVGVRWDTEKWPIDQIPLNQAWLTATGIDNTKARTIRAMLQPRVAFNWALGESRRWNVRGEAGVFAEPLDPAMFAEAVTHAVGTSIRRGFGALGSWPGVPDSVVAPVQGQSLTLLGPDFTPQRTGRVLFGITGHVGSSTLRIQGDYRHTDFLPLRHDLNLPTAPRARDQFGRVLYGTLAKSGTMISAVPGSNRRFSAFDEVSALDPAAASDFLAFSFGLERNVGRGLTLLAHYTYSYTRDNWVGARGDGAEAQFVPFGDSTGRSDWAKGASDFDVPHRLVLGGEIRVGGRAGVRLAALYRLRSGYPFTAGFRDGVDANGDGSTRNDPAFVSDTVAGAQALISQTGCLRAQVNRFAERNSCRDPMAGSLDMRLAATIGHFGRSTVQLTADGYGLVRTGEDVYDHALYLVDGAGTLSTNVTTAVTTVPLKANPNFGKVLTPRAGTASFRAGIQVDF